LPITDPLVRTPYAPYVVPWIVVI